MTNISSVSSGEADRHAPIEVVASMVDGVTMRDPIALDALLMACVAVRDELPPLVCSDESRPTIDIPIAKSTCGRVYLASCAQVDSWEAHDRRFVNRKFPLAEAQVLGSDQLKRIRISAGAQKSYRIPEMVAYPAGGEIRWYAVGHADEVAKLLTLLTHIGHRRAVGRGRVRSWSVGPCSAWDGFPVVRDGGPLRTLPVDWPGLVDPQLGERVLSPPYWERWRREVCAVPS